MSAPDLQSTADVLMIRPAHFASNPETLASNRFQQASADTAEEIRRSVLAEFDASALGAGTQICASVGGDGRPWLVSRYGSRIPADKCWPHLGEFADLRITGARGRADAEEAA
mgnify:CR=1 FL=1